MSAPQVPVGAPPLPKKSSSILVITVAVVVLILVGVVAVLMLTNNPSGWGAAAVSSTELAKYFPADTSLYATFDTSDALIGDLDDVYKKFSGALSDIAGAQAGEIPEDVPAILDMVTQ